MASLLRHARSPCNYAFHPNRKKNVSLHWRNFQNCSLNMSRCKIKRVPSCPLGGFSKIGFYQGVKGGGLKMKQKTYYTLYMCFLCTKLYLVAYHFVQLEKTNRKYVTGIQVRFTVFKINEVKGQIKPRLTISVHLNCITTQANCISGFFFSI